MTSWWDTEHWRAYEAAYGDLPGTRSQLLASTSFSTQVIDLTQDEAVLWKNLRRSYKALINQAERAVDIFPLMPIGVLTTCRPLHIQEAGRETRSFDTWRLMSDWIDQGHGFCLAAFAKQEPVAFAYFIRYGFWAYYASAASLEPNVNHALIWTAMKALKARGVRQLEMGWQGQAKDVKGQNIEMFRRGFGGRSVPVCEVATT